MKSWFIKLISFILIFSMTFYCCTSTHLISHQQSTYDELNEKLNGEKGQIILPNNEVIVGENIKVGTDSTSWTSSKINEDSVGGIQAQQVYQHIST